MVGHEAFARGMVYARNGQVSEVQIDPDDPAGHRAGAGRLPGRLRHDGAAGRQRARLDRASRALQLPGGPGLQARGGAADRGPQPAAGRRSGEQRPGVGGRARAARCARRRRPRSPTRCTLGLEFSVERMPGVPRPPGQDQPADASGAPGPPRLVGARAGSPGRSSTIRRGATRPQQRDLLLQIRTAAGAAARFSLPRSPWLSLAEVAAGFWSLLADAERVGLQLLVEGGGGRPPVITEAAGDDGAGRPAERGRPGSGTDDPRGRRSRCDPAATGCSATRCTGSTSWAIRLRDRFRARS